MDLKDYFQMKKLDTYSFLWSETRLCIAALALLLGGTPPALYLFPMLPIVGALLIIAWVISGVASGYMLYRWWTNGQFLFGRKDNLDMVAFFVNIVSGFNLGIAGIFGKNIGMSISSHYILFCITALVYLASALHLYRHFVASKKKIF